MTIKATWNWSRDPVTFDRANVVFVEGSDDSAFISGQVAELGLADEFQIHVMGGNKQDWRDRIEVALDDDWFSLHGESVAVVLDADSDAEAALQSARSMLSAAGVPPSAPNEVVSGPRLRLGALILAGSDGTGALEDLVIPALEVVQTQLAESYLKQSESHRGTPCRTKSKALLAAYLAAEEEFVGTLSTALKKPRVVDPSSPAFQIQRDFLSALANG